MKYRMRVPAHNIDVEVELEPIIVPEPEPEPEPEPQPEPEPEPEPDPDPVNPHPDDADKHAEHLAALALVPVVDATHVLTSGSLPVLPDGAKVYIPEGVTVTVDSAHLERIEWIRVNGTLRFARDAISNMRVDRCFVDTSGWLDLGTTDSPRTKPMDWLFIDNGPVTDPMQLGRSIIVHGRCDCVCVDGVEVTARSENAERLHRGMIMIMHKPATTIDGLRIIDCGRTDKSEIVTDFPNVENQRGRYPLHAHRCGLTTPMKWRRITIENSPGWGIVNHSSNVECDDSICRNTFGAGFVGEIGFERGWFRNCLAEDIPGTGKDALVQSSRVSLEHNDFGHAGHGVWIQGGGGILVEGCLIRRCANSGIVTMGKTAQNDETFLPMDEAIEASVFPQLAAGSIWFWGKFAMPTSVPVRIRNNHVYDCAKLAIEFWDNQNPDGHKYECGDISGNIIERCPQALLSGYSNRVNIIGNKLIGDPLNPAELAFGHTGITFDTRFEDNEVIGWKIGLHASTDGFENTVKNNKFQNVVNILFESKRDVSGARILGNRRTTVIENNEFLPLMVDPVQFWPKYLSLIPGERKQYSVFMCHLHPWFMLPDYDKPNPNWGWLFDSASTALEDLTIFDGHIVTFEEYCADFLIPVAVPQEVRQGATTSNELYELTDLALFGRVPVANWETSPVMRGRFVNEPVKILETPKIP